MPQAVEVRGADGDDGDAVVGRGVVVGVGGDVLVDRGVHDALGQV